MGSLLLRPGLLPRLMTKRNGKHVCDIFQDDVTLSTLTRGRQGAAVGRADAHGVRQATALVADHDLA